MKCENPYCKSSAEFIMISPITGIEYKFCEGHAVNAGAYSGYKIKETIKEIEIPDERLKILYD